MSKVSTFKHLRCIPRFLCVWHHPFKRFEIVFIGIAELVIRRHDQRHVTGKISLRVCALFEWALKSYRSRSNNIRC